MSGAADQRLDDALRAALAETPLDVLGLLARVRPALVDLLEGREGLLHAALQRLLKRGAVRVAGASEAGLPLYAWNGHGTPPAPSDWGPRASAHDGVAVGVSRAVRDPKDRLRVLVDVAAHRAQLHAVGREEAFGPARAALASLRRVDRGQRTVLIAHGLGGHVRRFLVHEGPWILGAVALFLTVKTFFADVFVIPSPSMVPTLALGDRVVVVKRGKGWKPERWQVVTFRHRGPDGPDTVFVKRAVGLPGEELSLWHGDVYANGRLLVKPDGLSQALRRPLASWDFSQGVAAAGWLAEDDGAGRTRLKPQDDPLATGHRYSGPLVDVYLDLEVELPGGSGGGDSDVTLGLSRSGGPGASTTTLLLSAGGNGVRLERSVLGPTPGGVAHVDRLLETAGPRSGRLTLSLSVIDGVPRARVGDHTWQGDGPLGAAAARFFLLTRGAGARPISLRVDQDLHYGNQGFFAGATDEQGPTGTLHRVADDALFMLGDNTNNSHDSREPDMGDIRIERLVGPVVFRIWPIGRIGLVP